MKTTLTTPMNRKVTIENGCIEGDYDDLAGWVRSGSRHNQELFMIWFLFLKEWDRQKAKESLVGLGDMSVDDWNNQGC